MKKLVCAIGAGAALLAVSACTSFVQTTSGESYLAKADAAGVTLSDELRNAASVEPILAFPARIGIARIEKGRLTDIPEDEWETLGAELEKTPGAKNEIVPVSLFVLDLALPRVEDAKAPVDRAAARRDIIDRLRVGGARQHLDAIIVYETHGQSESRANSLAIADWTLIGAYIAPGRKASAAGNATALMFDVRNGYPYGGASATVEKDSLAPTVYVHDRARDLLKETQSAAVADLAPKLKDMLTTLELEMAHKQSAEVR